jgi:hypothetical protein
VHLAQRGDHNGIELRAGVRAQFRERILRRPPGAVGAVAAHRVEGIGAEDDPGDDRDVLAGQAVGVARSVVALVARPHHAGDRGDLRHRGEDGLALEGMAAHDRPLPLVERAGLVDDLGRHGDLADVVELRDGVQVPAVLARHVEPFGDRLGQGHHVVGVLGGAVVVSLEHRDGGVDGGPVGRLLGGLLGERVHALEHGRMKLNQPSVALRCGLRRRRHACGDLFGTCRRELEPC